MRSPSPHHRLFGSAVAVTSLIAVTTSIVLAPAASSLARRPPSVAITVTSQRCAPGWAPRRAAPIVVRIDNRSRRGGTITLLDLSTNETVARVALRPTAVVRHRVNLTAGNYRWACHLRGLAVSLSGDVTVRPVFSVAGPAGPTAAIAVTTNQMAGDVVSYRAYVTGQLGLLSAEVQALRSDIGKGLVAEARSQWLAAHLTWEHTAGAHDAFGSLATSIDGTAGGLNDGVRSPRFTGFHKVELDLWQVHDLTAAADDAAALAGFVAALVSQFGKDTIPAAALPLRAHEILEDSLRDELSGDDDYGSGTDMASVGAVVDGTRALLAILAPLLKMRAPDLVGRATTQLDRLDTALAATEVDGAWVAVARVPLAQREQVDSAIGSALEILAPVPDLLPVRGASS